MKLDNVRTVMCNLPHSIGGFTILSDDYYTIVLNVNLTYKKNMQTYSHELTHIINGDFDKKISVGLIETLAHKE